MLVSHMTIMTICKCLLSRAGCHVATRVSGSGLSSDQEVVSLDSTGSEGVGGVGGGASTGNTVRPQNISLSSLLESVLSSLEEPKGIIKISINCQFNLYKFFICFF